MKVDRAKVEVTEKLPPTIPVKGVRNFLGHEGFYKCFIKDVSKIAHPLFNILEKDAKFLFDDVCLKAFKWFKQKLILAPIIIVPHWSKPFENLRDASWVTLGLALEQR